MLRLRTILLLVLAMTLVYALSPDERKTRIRDKLREIWRALVIAVALYWVYMLSLFAWKRWGK